MLEHKGLMVNLAGKVPNFGCFDPNQKVDTNAQMSEYATGLVGIT